MALRSVHCAEALAVRYSRIAALESRLAIIVLGLCGVILVGIVALPVTAVALATTGAARSTLRLLLFLASSRAPGQHMPGIGPAIAGDAGTNRASPDALDGWLRGREPPDSFRFGTPTERGRKIPRVPSTGGFQCYRGR